MLRFSLYLLLSGLIAASLGLSRLGLVTTRIGLFLVAIEVLSLAFPAIFRLLDGGWSLQWPGRQVRPELAPGRSSR